MPFSIPKKRLANQSEMGLSTSSLPVPEEQARKGIFGRFYDGLVSRSLPVVLSAGLVISACTSPSAPLPPIVPPPVPDIVMPAVCTDVPLSFADDVASVIGVDSSLVSKYWFNEDSAFLVSGKYCLTDQEKRFLLSLEDAVSSGLALNDSVLYWLDRFNTVGGFTNAAFDLTLRVTRDTNTSMPKILATIPYGTIIQPSGNLPGTTAARDSEGNLFVNYPINEKVSFWVATTWDVNSPVNSTFMGLFVDGLDASCGAPGQEVTQSFEVKFNPVFGGPALYTPVFNGSILPARILNVVYDTVLGLVPDVSVVMNMDIPHDDITVFNNDGSIRFLNMTRAPYWNFTYGHLIKGTEAEYVSPDHIGKVLAPGDFLGNTHAGIGGILDFTVTILAREDFYQGDIPLVFPRFDFTIPNKQGAYIFDPILAAYVSEALSAGVPKDLIVALDLPRYRNPAIFYQDPCKPLE